MQNKLPNITVQMEDKVSILLIQGTREGGQMKLNHTFMCWFLVYTGNLSQIR